MYGQKQEKVVKTELKECKMNMEEKNEWKLKKKEWEQRKINEWMKFWGRPKDTNKEKLNKKREKLAWVEKEKKPDWRGGKYNWKNKKWA